MSTKRRPGTDLNHDNWDEEEEAEEGGEFKKAPDDEIKKRILKTAKRRIKTESTTTSTEPTHAFSNFGGFVKTDGKPSNVTQTFSFLSGNKSSNALTTQPNTSNEKSKDYYSKIKGLNQTVCAWIKQHVDANPMCILTPIFDDYSKFLKEIENAEEKQNNNTTTSPVGIDKNETKSPMAVTSGFSFGAPLNSEITKSSSSIFATTVASSSTINSKNNFSFGANTSATPSGFSFGTSKPFTFSNVTKPTEKSDEQNDTEDNEDKGPPKVEFTPVVEENSLYSIRCKVFVKGKDSYNDRGIGMLYIKSVENSTKTQLIVRADTNLGNILLNILLTKDVPTKRMGKNNVMMICIPTPDSKPPPTTVLVRVKDTVEADKLLETINKHSK